MGSFKTGYKFFLDEAGNPHTETVGSKEDHENLIEAIGAIHHIRQSVPKTQVQPPAGSAIGSSRSKNLNKTFRQIANEYLDEKRHKLTQGTIEQREGNLGKLCALLPDTPLQGFSEGISRQLVSDLAILPKSMDKEKMKGGAWRKSGGTPIDGSTQNTYFSLYSRVITFALTRRDAKEILGNVKVKTLPKSKTASGNENYTDKELNRIFSGCVYTHRCHQKASRRDYMFWLPMLSLYSGMRLNELCQLHVKDIKQYQGIWYFDNNLNYYDPNVPDKQLKNKSATRLVPVHDELIRLGF